jgi:ABC-2 type transport system permease protein
MNAILTLAVKDLRIVSRDYFGLFWMFGFPLMYGLFFGAIFSGSGSGGTAAISVAVVDEDKTDGSKAFLERLRASPALRMQELDKQDAHDRVLSGKLVAYVLLKKGFGDTVGFMGGTDTLVEVGIDPSRKAEKEMLRGVLMEASFAGMQDLIDQPDKLNSQMTTMRKQIDDAKDLAEGQKKNILKFYGDLEEFLRGIKVEDKNAKGPKVSRGFQGMQIDIKEVTPENREPRSAFEITFPSAVLWGIMGCVTGFAISLVTERIQGTLQRLRVAPLSRAQVLAGKGLACFLACTSIAVVLLGIATLILGVRVQDPLQLTMAIVSTAVCFVGIMMLVSTLGKTEPAVAGAGWGILMPLAMLGGGMVPLFAMPAWMLNAASISPVKWSILALEGAIWRGYSLTDMLLPCGLLLGIGALCYSIGVANLARQDG